MGFFDFLNPIAGLASGAASIFSTIQNNKANAQLQEQANLFSAQQAQQAQGFNAEQSSINRNFNAAEAEKARGFNEVEAAKSRQWQESMSSTAYQRAMQDMKAAGLNPMLAYSQGGASSGGGATASGPAASGSAASGSGATAHAARMDPIVSSHAISSALEAAKTSPLIKQLEEQTTKTAQEAKTEEKRTQLTHGQAEKVAIDSANAIKVGKVLDENIKTAHREGVKGELDAELYQSKLGQASRQFGTWMRDLNPFVSNAKGLNQIMRGD